MIVAIWILTGLLAAMFLMAGSSKALSPYGKIAENPRMAWVEAVSPAQLKTIGALEVLGALGMILPAATGVLPWLTPVAAFALALTMAVAVALHVRRSEPYTPSLVLGLVATAVGVSWLVLA